MTLCRVFNEFSITFTTLHGGCRNGVDQRVGSVSDPESDEENEEGDYTVYECPGFATTGEMEVKNPLFSDDPTPATPGKDAVKPDDEVTTHAKGAQE
ncbi:Neural proliferation differentiation and control protein 1 [Eumeta japonica]|uniref:Neural proliferation differentiation and control protein 1 n=1 Tax=Eumeta variegata TaxID=151549 RepID=A0A4C2A5G5_EUMVA|nr:Neural proliferation differentiation and control protein 1 [Eumeta japonica]